jgi:GMP synthase (glutamine-hydrolysing)
MPHRVLIIQNDPPETLGTYEAYLREKAEVTLIQAYEMKPRQQYPSTDGYDAFIIGPTPVSANDVQDHGFLRKEWVYLQQVIDSGKPCLGVCCGGQILARLLGGQVTRSPSKEIGGYTVALTDHGLSDPLFRGFPRQFPVFHWHQDVFTVPPEGVLLATGSPCPIQAYAWGSIRGLIFHLEITSRDAERWADAYPDEPAAIGKTRGQVLEECRVHEHEMRRLAEKLMNNLLAMPSNSHR